RTPCPPASRSPQCGSRSWRPSAASARLSRGPLAAHAPRRRSGRDWRRMFGLLDLYTLFFIGSVNAFICALMLFALRRLHAPSRPGLVWGSATNLLLGSAMALIAMRGHMPGTVSVLLANILATVAALAIYQSFRLFCLRPPRNGLFWSVAACLVAAQLALGTSIEHPFHALRITIACTAQAGCELLVVPLLLKR